MKRSLPNFVCSLFNDLLWPFKKNKQSYKYFPPRRGGGVEDHIKASLSQTWLGEQKCGEGVCSAPAASEELGAKHVTVPNPNKFSLSATALSENQMRAKVCEARDGEALSFGGQCGTVPNRRYERSVSEVNEAICDCTGGKVQTGAIVACDEQGTKHYESAVASKASEQIFDLTGGKVQKSFAFTLSELLMSVLVVSIILVAMAPVITKRTSDNISVNAVKTEGILFTTRMFENSTNFDIECTDLDADGNTLNYNVCKLSIPDGVNNINMIAVSAGGGGGGAGASYNCNGTTDSPSIVQYSTNGANAKSLYETIITPGSRDFTAMLLSASGGGGGGAFRVMENEPPHSQQECEPYNATYIPIDSEKGFCITNDVIGIGKLTLSENFTLVDPTKYARRGTMCWGGEDFTATAYLASPSENYYRVVCPYESAENVCNNLAMGATVKGDWKLPTVEQMELASSYLASNAQNQLLCSSTTSVTPYCTSKTTSSSCRYSSTVYGCHPNLLWTQDKGATGSSYKYVYKFDNTTSLTKTELNYNIGASAKCVLAAFAKKIQVAQGGGGQGGNYIEGIKIPNDVLKENVGGVVRIFASPKQEGGKNAEIAGESGEDGLPEIDMWTIYNKTYEFIEDLEEYYEVHSYDSTGVFVYKEGAARNEKPSWGVALLAGKSGSGADSGYSGGGGYSPEDVTTDLSDTDVGVCCNGNYCSSMSEYYCNATYNIIYGKSGQDGALIYDIENYSGSDATSYTAYTNGVGGNAWAPTGIGFYSAWSGGSGGYPRFKRDSETGEITQVTSGRGTTLQGGSGTAGSVRLSGYNYCSAAGGGGGGGGRMFYFKNIDVQNDREIEIHVGKAGQGGASGQFKNGTGVYEYAKFKGKDGTAGGESGIKLSETKYLFAKGGNYGGGGGLLWSSNTMTQLPSVGSYGSAGSYSYKGFTLSQLLEEKALIQKAGGRGNSGRNMQEEFNGVKYVTLSTGGSGGKSPLGAFGGCGGLYTTSSSGFNDTISNPNCANSSADGIKIETVLPGAIEKTNDYGSAGAGGGGGGWSYDFYNNPGKGADGQEGYVYIWWVKVE